MKRILAIAVAATLSLPGFAQTWFTELFRESGVKGGIQGAAVFGDKFFQFHDHNTSISIFDLRTGALIQDIPTGEVKTWHNNNVNFSTVYYEESDRYPLVYASQENIKEHRTVVWRITEDAGGVFSARIVQTIIFPDPMQMGLYYPNLALDNENGKIYLTGYSLPSWNKGDNGNGVQLLRFPLPSPVSGETVYLGTGDIEARFCNRFRIATQGAAISGGKLYQSFGVPSLGETRLVVTDLETGRTEYESALGGISDEPEGLGFWQGRIVIVCGKGGVYLSR